MSRNWIYLTWREKTWNERGQTVLSWILALVITFGMFIGGLLVLGMAIDGTDRYRAEHDRCLKKAENGYDIKQCH